MAARKDYTGESSPVRLTMVSKGSQHLLNYRADKKPGIRQVFTPKTENHQGSIVYRFQTQQPGSFKCEKTGLIFHMEVKGEVVYRLAPWRDHYIPAGRIPAGPLYNVQKSQGSLEEVELPHCEVSADKSLQITSVTKRGTDMLKPLKVTAKYVAVAFAGLTLVGLIKSMTPSSVQGQILVLYHHASSELYVFLLPRNVPPGDVHKQEQLKNTISIPTSSMCTLLPGKKYSMSCKSGTAQRIQPEHCNFESKFDAPFHINYVISMNRDAAEAELNLQDLQSKEVVWKYIVKIPGRFPVPEGYSGTDAATSSGLAFVKNHRTKLIQKVTMVDPILDDLLPHIGDETYKKIRALPVSQDKMRALYENLNTERKKQYFFDSDKKRPVSCI